MQQLFQIKKDVTVIEWYANTHHQMMVPRGLLVILARPDPACVIRLEYLAKAHLNCLREQ